MWTHTDAQDEAGACCLVWVCSTRGWGLGEPELGDRSCPLDPAVGAVSGGGAPFPQRKGTQLCMRLRGMATTKPRGCCCSVGPGCGIC